MTIVGTRRAVLTSFDAVGETRRPVEHHAQRRHARATTAADGKERIVGDCGTDPDGDGVALRAEALDLQA